MFKLGGFYLTQKGQLVKIFNTFEFVDGYNYNAAVYTIGHGWIAVRYTQDGKCNVDANHNINNFETFDKYAQYMQFVVWFDRASAKWCGRATDPRGSEIVKITDLDNRERAMSLIQLGAEQKVLSWMREAGYDEETKELVNA